MERIGAACVAKGIIAGIMRCGTPETAEQWRRAGYRMLGDRLRRQHADQGRAGRRAAQPPSWLPKARRLVIDADVLALAPPLRLPVAEQRDRDVDVAQPGRGRHELTRSCARSPPAGGRRVRGHGGDSEPRAAAGPPEPLPSVEPRPSRSRTTDPGRPGFRRPQRIGAMRGQVEATIFKALGPT